MSPLGPGAADLLNGRKHPSRRCGFRAPVPQPHADGNGDGNGGSHQQPDADVDSLTRLSSPACTGIRYT